MMASSGFVSLPFYLAGGLKIVYDLLLYRDFRSLNPPEEGAQAATAAPGARPGGPPAAAG
jgi:hypothetical protein